MADISLIQLAATIAKVLFGIFVALQVVPLMPYIERKQMAFIQRRVGPNRVGIFGFLGRFGVGHLLTDPVKLLFKEDFVPPHVNRFFYLLAPAISAVAGLTAMSAIPWGSYFLIGGEKVTFQAVNLNAGFLFVFAISALAVYSAALAGWSSNNKYALFGGLRASAQMVSYEIAMGLSLIPVVLIYNTLDLQSIIGAQSDHLLFGFLPAWGVFYAPVSFVIFMVTIFAETNRLPFDLAEGESELVAGFLVEYGSMRWSMFFLGEYAMMVALSALTCCLFLGGYELPWLTHAQIIEWLSGPLGEVWGRVLANFIAFNVLMAKVAVFLLFFVQVRFTLPRLRYDQLMKLGWTVLLPIALANLFITTLVAAAMKF